MKTPVEMPTLIGRTFTRIVHNEPERSIDFYEGEDDLASFTLYHEQDCCESVHVEDIAGDLSDLECSPILGAEESSRNATADECSESGTWTFYKLHTAKGYVTIRFLGESNGYYSESVQLYEVT